MNPLKMAMAGGRSGFVSTMASSSVMSIGMGAMAGAIGGGWLAQGGVGGAVGGAFTGALAGAAIGHGGPAAMKAFGRSGMSSNWGTEITQMANSMQTREARTAMFGGGGLLSGMAWGGVNNRRKGFNANRGNSVSRG